MPPAAKDVSFQRAQDKELKRSRGAMSCAECRRLKLKCDKTIPCSSCRRRGCAAICPNGSLVTGQGTRFVLADTGKLHQKIADMSERIRQLEDGLSILTAHDPEPHPLLRPDLTKIKSSIDLHSATGAGPFNSDDQADTEETEYVDAFGTLALRDDGAATYFGRSAGHEGILIGEDLDLQSDVRKNGPSITQSSGLLPPVVLQYSASFPFPPSEYHGLDVESLVESFLPPWQEAWRLTELYLEQAPWFFGAVTRTQIIEEILPTWYPEAGELAGPSASKHKTFSRSHHDLALVFVIFCFGAVTDMNLPAPPDNQDADFYFELTRATLNLEPLLDRPGSVAAVQTLSLMAIYKGMCAGEHSIESTWALMGMSTRMAQSIGLHHDTARWNLSPAEVQKRRALFWELFITDCWQSLATGRLATFSLPFVGCELPNDPDKTLADDGTVIPSFPAWKASFGAECVSAVVQHVLTSRAPKHSTILELDRRVRDMSLPLYAQKLPPKGAGLAQTMSHFMPINYQLLTLLYIHRGYFSIAVQNHPQDPLKNQYAPSFLAGYRSACELIASIKTQFSYSPPQIARFWVLWTHSFSAATMLASVVTRCPQSKVASAAFVELRVACELFEKAAQYGGRAKTFFPILQRMQRKAHQTFVDVHSGIAPAIKNDIFTPGQQPKDDLDVFSGMTHTVATKAKSSSSSRAPRVSAQSSEASSSSGQQSATPATIPSFAGVHPSLIDQLHQFDGLLNARIQNAYYQSFDPLFHQSQDKAQYTSPPHSSQPPAVSEASGSTTYHSAVEMPYTTAPMAPAVNHQQDPQSGAIPTQVPSKSYNRTQATQQNPMSLEPQMQSYVNHLQEQPQHWSAYPTQNGAYQLAQGNSYHPAQPPAYANEQYAPPAQYHPQPYMYQYPGRDPGALDDPRLQEGWTAFMRTVGSPPPLSD